MKFFTETILTASYDAKINVLRQLIEMATNFLDNYEKQILLDDCDDPEVVAYWRDEFIDIAIDYRKVYSSIPTKVDKIIRKRWSIVVDRFFKLFPV